MLTTMQRRDEHDVVVFLQLVLVLALELPVCFVDENEDAWPAFVPLVSICVFPDGAIDLHCVVENKQFLTRIFHKFVA